MSRYEFDLGDFGDLDESSSFPTEEDAEFLPPDNMGGPSERPPRNTTFLIIAIVLVLLFLGALGGIAALVLNQSEIQRQTSGTAQAVLATNTQVQAFIFATQTAKAWTKTPTPTSTPTDTPTPTPTNTPTETPTNTPSPTVDVAGTQTQIALNILTLQPSDLTATENAIQTENAVNTQIASGGGPTPTVEGGIGGADTATPGTPGTGTGPITATSPGGSGTAIGFGQSATPTPANVTPLGPTATGQQVNVNITVGAKTATAIATSLAHTGFFDDIAGGKASPSSLAVVGLAAFGLVGLIFVARRFRVR